MKRDERGIALVITLFLMASLSALAVSMMFLAQTETASSRNYRTMSQARYAGEAGVHRAINYLYNQNNDPSLYSPPTLFADYGMTQSPVTCLSAINCSHVNLTGACDPSTVTTAVNTGCIVLVANFGGLSSNYPDSTVRNAFSGIGQGTLAVNGSGSTTNGALGTVGYGTAAILMSMRPVTVYGGFSRVLQTWRIVSDGTAGPSSLLATVEVQATFERTLVPAETFAVFATNPDCNAIQYSGSGGTGNLLTILLGSAEKIHAKIEELRLHLNGAQIVDPAKFPRMLPQTLGDQAAVCPSITKKDTVGNLAVAVSGNDLLDEDLG